MEVFTRIGCAVVVLTLSACSSSQRVMDSERVTQFDGQVLHVAVTADDGSTERFNSVRDHLYSWSFVPAIPGHAGRRWAMLKTTTDDASLVYTVVSWNNDDPTDYLAAGWWLRFPGELVRSFFFRGFSLVDAQGSAFIDGPELDPADPPQMPDAGQATYVGGAGGLYRYRYGSDWSGFEQPEYLEEFTGTITLTADFSDNTIAGCVGCIGDIELDREHLYSALGYRSEEPVALPTDYELHLAPTAIGSDGAFESSGVTVVHSGRDVTQSSGSWSGNLSNIPDADGYPRLVAGTAGAQFDESDGSHGEFQSLYTGLGLSLLPPPGERPNP